jgi:hypothetical protein
VAAQLAASQEELSSMESVMLDTIIVCFIGPLFTYQIYNKLISGELQAYV